MRAVLQVTAKREALIRGASKASRDLGMMASGLLRIEVETRTSARALKAAFVAKGLFSHPLPDHRAAPGRVGTDRYLPVI